MWCNSVVELYATVTALKAEHKMHRIEWEIREAIFLNNFIFSSK